MALVTLAGADLLEGEVHLPPFGPWFAHLKIDDPSIAPGPATLAAANGLSLAGYITEVGEFLGASHAHMVGGAGGLATQVSGAWRQAQLRDPVQAVDLACAVGSLCVEGDDALSGIGGRDQAEARVRSTAPRPKPRVSKAWRRAGSSAVFAGPGDGAPGG